MRPYIFKAVASLFVAMSTLSFAAVPAHADQTEDVKLLTVVCTAVYSIQLEQGSSPNAANTTSKMQGMRTAYKSVSEKSDSETDADVEKAKDLVKSRIAADPSVMTGLVQTCDSVAEG